MQDLDGAEYYQLQCSHQCLWKLMLEFLNEYKTWMTTRYYQRQCSHHCLWKPALEFLNQYEIWTTPDTRAAAQPSVVVEPHAEVQFLNGCKTWTVPDTISYNAAI